MTTIQEFDYSVDLLRAILWQYNDAERLQSLLAAKSEWYQVNQTDFWGSWYDDVFNLQTANDFGLTVWGAILGIDLSIEQPGTGDRPVWGFGEYNLNFGNANFGRDSAGTSALTLEQKRLVLRLRYYQLVSDGTVPFTNFILNEIFGQGAVIDGLDMTQNFVIFSEDLPATVQAVLENFDLLPRPAGVELAVIYNSKLSFGFAPFYQNFNNGVFGV